MMVKRVLPGSWDFGTSNFELVKTANDGRLRGNDLQTLIKRAGHAFVDRMNQVEFHPGEVPIHLIALGATEYYGPNRNGDGFKEAACRKYCHTFVTKPVHDRRKEAACREGAYYYRNHVNKDPYKSYGTVKMAVYNEAMKRVELLVALNGTKEAAERNMGLLADEELQKIARGDQDWGTSMACRVPYDICSGCGHKAKTRADYCTESTCKYGGCKYNLTKVAEDGHVLHVDNDQPDWFDISGVGRNADRIAFVMGQMQKSASGSILGGAAMAEQFGMTVPPHLRYAGVDDRTARLIKLAYEMADLEQSLSPRLGLTHADLALASRNTPEVQVPPSRAAAYQALAHQKVALCFRDWVKIQEPSAGGVLTKSASYADPRLLDGLFGRLVADGDSLERYLTDRTCDPSSGAASTTQHVWAAKLADTHSIGDGPFRRRLTRAIFEHDPSCGMPGRRGQSGEKSASFDPKAEDTARRYAAYQLFLLDEWRADPAQPDYRERLVRMNHAG